MSFSREYRLRTLGSTEFIMLFGGPCRHWHFKKIASEEYGKHAGRLISEDFKSKEIESRKTGENDDQQKETRWHIWTPSNPKEGG